MVCKRSQISSNRTKWGETSTRCTMIGLTRYRSHQAKQVPCTVTIQHTKHGLCTALSQHEQKKCRHASADKMKNLAFLLFALFAVQHRTPYTSKLDCIPKKNNTVQKGSAQNTLSVVEKKNVLKQNCHTQTPLKTEAEDKQSSPIAYRVTTGTLSPFNIFAI